MSELTSGVRAPAVLSPSPLAAPTRAALPTGFVLFCGGVGAVGVMAGVAANPLLLWTTPPFVAFLLLRGVRRVRQATELAVAPGETPLTLPPGVAPLVAESLEQLLPAGAARPLLADVARLASALYVAAGPSRAADPSDDDDGGVGELVAAACDSALALDRAERALATLQRGDPTDAPTARRRRDAATECGRIRDALSQRMLETVAALGEACADTGRASEVDSGARLGELARALQHDAALRRAAAEEVEALLNGEPRDG